MSNRFDRENAEIALNVLAKGKARTFEIRIPKAGRFGTISGYFNGFVALADALATLDKGEYEGCYITLNPVNPALLARASNQFKNWSQVTTNDADIARREWMLVDIDPQRPTGISSTNEEKAAAKKLAIEVRNWLREQGWADPVVCDSGNGFHLLYPVDLPNDELSRDMIRECLEALADKFDTPTVHIDRKVYNAARIVKAYGSVARKGDSTDERPHRTARMFAPPEKLGEVTLVQLAAVADLTEKKQQPKKARAAEAEGPWTEDDLRDLFEAAGWQHRDPVPYKGAQKYVGICPRNPEHKDFAVFFEDGWVNVECFHNSCADFKKVEQFVEETGADFEIPRRATVNMDFLGVMDADEKIEEAKAAVQQTAGLTEPFNLTDIGNMERLVWRHGSKLKYAVELKWLTWDGKRWCEDKMGKAQRFAWNTVRLIPEEAKLIKVPDKEVDEEGHQKAMARIEAIYGWAEASEMGGHVSLMLKHTQSAMGVAATAAEFDQDLNLLNTGTGTIDLITGETHAHDREDMLTKIAPEEYDPQAKCPLWEKFMLEIMDGKQHMVDFLQRALGYSLTGETREHKLFIMWGGGANGKTTMLEVVRHVMGDYSQAAEFTTFVAKKDARTGATPDLAMLRGARFVSATEGEKQHKLAESLVKQLTGGDTIVARHLFCEYFQFVPQFKIWLGTNHKPEISGTDDGIWRRVCLIPFNVSFADCADAQLKEKLKREAPGILAWMVRGLVEWRKHGLMEPEEVKAATAAYRADEDLIVRFMNEEASVGNDEARARDVYNRYKDWVRDNHEGELSERKFAEAMKEHGYTKVRRETGVFYKGFKLQPKQVWTPQTSAMASGDEEL